MRKISNLFIWLILLFSLLNNNCKKDNNTEVVKNVPSITTKEVTDIKENSAICGGIITDEGSGTITHKGVCWSINSTPTISDSKIYNGPGADEFTSNISGLYSNTTYYVRAYATNDSGTGYGMTMSFKTLEINCMLCKTVSTDSSNGDVVEGSEEEYCGDALGAILNMNSVTVGTVTTHYECRDLPTK